MTAEIANPYPILGAVKMADWVGDGLAAISPDPSEIAAHLSGIHGRHSLIANRAEGCLSFGKSTHRRGGVAKVS